MGVEKSVLGPASGVTCVGIRLANLIADLNIMEYRMNELSRKDNQTSKDLEIIENLSKNYPVQKKTVERGLEEYHRRFGRDYSFDEP